MAQNDQNNRRSDVKAMVVRNEYINNEVTWIRREKNWKKREETWKRREENWKKGDENWNKRDEIRNRYEAENKARWERREADWKRDAGKGAEILQNRITLLEAKVRSLEEGLCKARLTSPAATG